MAKKWTSLFEVLEEVSSEETEQEIKKRIARINKLYSSKKGSQKLK